MSGPPWRPSPSCAGNRLLLERLADKAGLEDQLELGVHKLIMLAEAYPDLKANRNFLELQTELVEIEDHLQYARRFYNGSVRILNTRIETVPDVIIAILFRFRVADFFEAETRAAPEVKFLMFRIFRLLPSLTACMLLLQPLHATEHIIRFHSDIEVATDSSMRVTETIRVRAEGEQIRRGIYREFPTDYRDRLNNRIQVGFEVLERYARWAQRTVLYREVFQWRARVHRSRGQVPPARRIRVCDYLPDQPAARVFRWSR